MKKAYFYFLSMVFFILSACTYKPGGEEFVKVDPTPKSPDIQINLNLAADTIFIKENQLITFAYKLNDEKVLQAQFVVNGNVKDLAKDPQGNILLSYNFGADYLGTNPLEIRIVTNSHTGSIADKIGVEGVMISHKWTLVVIDEYHMASKITKAEFVDGSLKLQWDRYKGMDFTYYKVYKQMQFGQIPENLVPTITSRDQLTFVDTTYHGERTDYYITTNNSQKYDRYRIEGPLPVLTASNTNQGQNILLKWTKPPYYKNLKGYRLSYYDYLGAMQLIDVNNSETESYNFLNPLFAFNYNFYLSPLGRSGNYYSDWELTYGLSTQLAITYGLATPKFTIAQAGLAPLTYLLTNYNEGILVFDQQKLASTRRINFDTWIYQFSVSPNNKYLVSVSLSPPKINFEDLTDTTRSKKINASTTFPQLSQAIAVSNIGTGFLINGNTGVIYDFINETKLAEIGLINYGSMGSKISASGNYFYRKTDNISYEYFQYKNNQIIPLPNKLQSGDLTMFGDFMPGTNEKLIRAFYNRVEVLDCSTWTIEKQWQIPNKIIEVYNLDYKSGKLLLREKNNLILFDVINGTSETVTNIGGSENAKNAWTLFYNNGQVLWSEGKTLIK